MATRKSLKDSATLKKSYL
jgi:hypothetical protein